MLDETSDVASIFHPEAPGTLSGAYWDAVAALEPLLPPAGAERPAASAQRPAGLVR